MGKAIADQVLDASIDELATATRQTVCSGEPANYAGISAVALADVVLTPGVGNGDYTKANGDTSGRKLVVAAQEDYEIDADGTATHIAYDDGAVLLGVTTCPSQVLTDGGTVSVGSHKFEWLDPA